MSVPKQRQAKVLEYLRGRPASTARDVARDVFGGTGATRTPERSYAHTTLLQLEVAGTARRYRPYRAGAGDQWEAVSP